MKATLDIPDTLYRSVKAKSALAGHPVRDIAIRLFSEWVAQPHEVAPAVDDSPKKMPPWFGIANAYASKVNQHSMASVRDSIAKARQHP